MPRFSTLERKFIVSMLLPVLLITVAWLTAYGIFSYRSSKHDLEVRVHEITTAYTGALAKAIWDLDYEKVDLLVETIGVFPGVASVHVADDLGRRLAVRSGSPEVGDVIFEAVAPILRQDVIGETQIGELAISMHDGRLWAMTASRLADGVVLAVAVMLTIAIAAVTVNRRAILEPLRRLSTAIADTRMGNSYRTVEYRQNDEIGEVIAAYDALMLSLDRKDRLLKRHEADLEAARRKAEEANRLKSEFLASMSHEIRTPLNGVLGMAGLLHASRLGHEQREYVEAIQESGSLLLAIINDILDLAKIEAGRLTLESIDFELEPMIRSITSFWEPQARAKGLVMETVIDRLVEPTLLGDPTRIRQIAFNLLSNAIKFTESGYVRLEVGQERLERGMVRTCLTVLDTGIGVGAEGPSELFEKFTQADNSTTRRYGGTGLGLAISKQLVEAMGGAIGGENRAGGGSRFWFTIVCPPGQAPSAIARMPQAVAPDWEDAAASPLRILVADDNHINQRLILALLERHGHQVDIVENGLEAVEALRTAPYDAVLMDIQMPEMDGVTAARHIREMEGPAAEVPIIALTANAMKGDREGYVAAGLSDYVSKPIDAAELDRVIRKHAELQRAEA